MQIIPWKTKHIYGLLTWNDEFWEVTTISSKHSQLDLVFDGENGSTYVEWRWVQCVYMYTTGHTEKGLYITHKSILMKHQTNKQTNKQTYSATINIGKKHQLFIQIHVHKCNYPLHVKKKGDLPHWTWYMSQLMPVLIFWKSMPMTIQLKTICQLYRAIVQGKLQYKCLKKKREAFPLIFDDQ